MKRRTINKMSNLKLSIMKNCNLIISILIGLLTTGIVSGQDHKAYVADIIEMNPKLTKGEVSGQAMFIIADDVLTITMAVKGLAPNMMHLQHFHGFIDAKKAACPPSNADTNGDGVIDLIETEPYAGTTLVPFNGSPLELKIKSDSYPVADANGLATYQISIPLEKLKMAIKKEYGIDELLLENRVIFIHGIPEDMPLPDTAESLPGVPAYITVPIACGVIKAL